MADLVYMGCLEGRSSSWTRAVKSYLKSRSLQPQPVERVISTGKKNYFVLAPVWCSLAALWQQEEEAT